MKYVLTAEEMKTYDHNTINRIGIPSLVLMERASLAVAEELLKRSGAPPKRVLVVAGTGNNGGDGLAIGRILALKGSTVTFYLAGNPEKMTPETRHQAQILQNLGFSIQSNLKETEYDMVIDALFGIGLSRAGEGIYAQIIEVMNRLRQKGAYLCAVDIPSGICADTGKILSCAVKADLTVTFAFVKRGHLLYPGKEYTGELVVKDIGITEHAFGERKPTAFCYEERALNELLPKRRPDGNKGTFGKVLLLAGSRDLCGACILCGSGILRGGAGMVKIMTPACNRETLLKSLPEAMLLTYEEHPDEKMIREALAWCDVVVAGPGIGTGQEAGTVLQALLEETQKPMVIDADGLNLIAEHEELAQLAAGRKAGQTILTPHPGELRRLLKSDKETYREKREELVRQLAEKMHCIVVSKDAATIVVQDRREKMYLNTSGSNALATAGSGDVLAGLTGALLAQGMTGFEGACLAAFLQGLAGQRAEGMCGAGGVIASDLIGELMQVMKGQGH